MCFLSKIYAYIKALILQYVSNQSNFAFYIINSNLTERSNK